MANMYLYMVRPEQRRGELKKTPLLLTGDSNIIQTARLRAQSRINLYLALFLFYRR